MSWLGRLINGGVLAAVAGGLSLLAAGERREVIEAEARLLPTPTGEDEPPARPAPKFEQRVEAFGALLGRTVQSVGARGAALRDRAEQGYAVYRVLRALGMSDAEIAGLIARQARSWVETEVLDQAPTADDARRAADDLAERVVRVAAEVDDRLGLHGDFVRPVREGLQTAKAGREDALTAAERTLAGARALFRTLLKEDEGH